MNETKVKGFLRLLTLGDSDIPRDIRETALDLLMEMSAPVSTEGSLPNTGYVEIKVPAFILPYRITRKLYDEVTRTLNLGYKIEAIKILRAGTNLGLKEAKDAIDIWTSTL